MMNTYVMSTLVSTVLIVSESEFTNGIANEIPMDGLQDCASSLSGGGGLGVYMKEDMIGPDITLLIDKCKFVNNSGDYGGNLLYFTNDCGLSILSKEFIFIVNSIFQNGTAVSAGGGLHMSLVGGVYTAMSLGVRKNHISIDHSEIMFNSAQEGGGGISILITGRVITSKGNTGIIDMEGDKSDRVSIHFTDIIGNKGDIGSALKLYGRSYNFPFFVPMTTVGLRGPA